MEKGRNEIFLDLDRDRIRSVLSETYRSCKDILGVSFDITEGEFTSRVEPYLDTNRISTPVLIDLPCGKYPGLKIEVNLRRAKVFARIPSRRRFHKKQVELNRYLKAL